MRRKMTWYVMLLSAIVLGRGGVADGAGEEYYRVEHRLATTSVLTLVISVQHNGCPIESSSGSGVAIARSSILSQYSRDEHACPHPECTPGLCQPEYCMIASFQSDSAACGEDPMTSSQIGASALASASDPCELVGGGYASGSVDIGRDWIQTRTIGGMKTLKEKYGNRIFEPGPPCGSCCETFYEAAGYAFHTATASGELRVRYASSCSQSVDIRLDLNSTSDLERIDGVMFYPPPNEVPPTPATQERRIVRFASLKVRRLTLINFPPQPRWVTTYRQGAIEEFVGETGKHPHSAKRIGLFADAVFNPSEGGVGPDSSIYGIYNTTLPNLLVLANSDMTITSETDSFSRYGDLNKDGVVCSADRPLLEALIAGGAHLNDAIYTPRGDFDLDGVIDADDLTAFDAAQATELDCNENDVPDYCDISSGTSVDMNQNGVLDECE